MSENYTGRHHETRIGVHRKSSTTLGYRPRHAAADIEIAVPTPGRRRADVELAVKAPTRKSPPEPALSARYTGQHTRKPKSAAKRADSTSKSLKRGFGATIAGFAFDIWQAGAQNKTKRR